MYSSPYLSSQPPPGYYTGYTSSPSASPARAQHTYYNTAPPLRNHSRHASTDAYAYSPRPVGTTSYPSPRYSSAGQYSTRAAEYSSPSGKPEYVSSKARETQHKPSRSRSKSAAHAQQPERRPSYSFRASHGDSDEDEIIEDAYGRTYVLPASSRTGPGRKPAPPIYIYREEPGTDHTIHQAYPLAYDKDGHPVIVSEHPVRDPSFEEPTRRSHSRRASESTPKRSSASASTPKRPSASARHSDARPSSSQKKAADASPGKATEADARKHRIPAGYSLKNWDPTEEPILLLGSVFDANSLGKWIYDWTVYHHGPATPMSDMAGELWLLLIQLAGKIKRAERISGGIRRRDNREMVEDFIESGERLTKKLRELLKACETPMLKAGKRGSKDSAQLGENAGTEFVDSIFGRDRMLDSTEQLMASIRLWNMRFDKNCEEVLRKPHA